jgi:signal transduction histidine kinase
MSAYVLGETLASEPLSPTARERVARELEAISRTREELDGLLAQELRGGGSSGPFDPLALARECGDQLVPLARERAVAIVYEGHATTICGDRLRLKQAIANVVRNAIEAAPAGSTIEVTAAREASDLRLKVQDRGAGLSAAAKAHLFEPLVTEKPNGLGMGLYVARAIVEAHGGTLTLVSDEHGTEATICLGDGAPSSPATEAP